MREFITSAIVLGIRPRGGNDRAVDLLTLALGRVEARMVAGRALISKFAPHCDPLNYITVRLVKKNRYTLADAVAKDRFSALRRSRKAFAEGLEALFALRSLVPKEETDPRLFHEVRRALAGARLTVARVLSLLGYDPAHGHCNRCRSASVAYFIPRDGVFFCAKCVAGVRDEVVLEVRC